jgi:E3 ubiquitin-protein ligase DRIP
MLLLILYRPDHSLQHIRSLIFPPKRRKVVTMKKRKERVSSELTLSSVVGITAEGSTALALVASESKAQKVVIEVIDEADEGLGD